jgi:hypothetical protein
MIVAVTLRETSQPIVHEEVTNAYTKGDLYCVYIQKSNRVYKYPLVSIWRIEESYS